MAFSANLVQTISNQSPRQNRDRAIALISWTLTVMLAASTAGAVMRYPVILESIRTTQKTTYAEVQRTQHGALSLIGQIGKKSTKSFIRLLEEDDPDILLLNSIGGLIEEANSIATLVKKRNIDVIVMRECFSACVLIAISGKTLYASANAMFGFHQASIMGEHPSSMTRFMGKKATEGLFRDLRRGGIPEAILSAAQRTPNDDMHYVTAAELKKLGVKIELID